MRLLGRRRAILLHRHSACLFMCVQVLGWSLSDKVADTELPQVQCYRTFCGMAGGHRAACRPQTGGSLLHSMHERHMDGAAQAC